MVTIMRSEHTTKRATEIAARVWCDQDMSDIVMDSQAVEAIAHIIAAVLEEQESRATIT